MRRIDTRWPSYLRVASLWLLLAAACAAPIRGRADDVARIVVIGDVHGAYESFVSVLVAAGIVDAHQEWVGGDARLVVLGDVLDRGAGSRAALELIMRLQDQAAHTGGGVELLLGNHEVMNLVGDLRYVAAGDYAAYRADESPADRAAAWERYRGVAAGEGRSDAELAADFVQRYPPGFFGQRAAFSRRGRFGEWLLERPVLTTIERTAFVHGGLPPGIDGKTAAEINREYGDALREYVAVVEVLTDAGVLHPEDSFYEHEAIAARSAAASGSAISDLVRRAAERLSSLARSAVFRSDAVFWYRGTAACSGPIERARLARELRTLNVDRVVIGHTPTAGARVLSRFDGAVIRADTGMLAAYFGGRPAAVVISGADVHALYVGEPGERPVNPQPRKVGPGSGDLGDDELEELLLNSAVIARDPRADGTELLHLEHHGARVDAIFRPVSASRRGFAALPEVAAYRLDRLLELDLVPVAVRREIDARSGSLQLDVAGLPDDRERTGESQSTDAWCPLRDQFNLMYVFDVLVGNEGRAPSAARYVSPGWQLVLTDNRRMLGPDGDPPEYLRTVRIDLPAQLAAQLEGLTAEALASRLGDVLDERQREAILARRDWLLRHADTP